MHRVIGKSGGGSLFEASVPREKRREGETELQRRRLRIEKERTSLVKLIDSVAANDAWKRAVSSRPIFSTTPSYTVSPRKESFARDTLTTFPRSTMPLADTSAVNHKYFSVASFFYLAMARCIFQ